MLKTRIKGIYGYILHGLEMEPGLAFYLKVTSIAVLFQNYRFSDLIWIETCKFIQKVISWWLQFCYKSCSAQKMLLPANVSHCRNNARSSIFTVVKRTSRCKEMQKSNPHYDVSEARFQECVMWKSFVNSNSVPENFYSRKVSSVIIFQTSRVSKLFWGVWKVRVSGFPLYLKCFKVLPGKKTTITVIHKTMI